MCDVKKESVAIIGGGVSGLYTAYRIKDSFPDHDVVIFESNDRIGGRLDSDLIVIDGHTIREEQGGMRFNEKMLDLWSLIAELGLCDQTVPFLMAPEKPNGQPAPNHDRYFLRNRSFTVEEASNPLWAEIYSLEKTGKKVKDGLNPTAILQWMKNEVIDYPPNKAKGNPYCEATQNGEYWSWFRNEFEWNGTKLTKWGLGGLMTDMGFNQECIEMLANAVGFAGVFKKITNAGEAFQLLGDFDHPVFHTFQKGFSTLVNALYGKVKEQGVKIHLSTLLYSLNKCGDQYDLEFRKEEKKPANRFSKGKQNLPFDRVILALPPAAIMGIFNASPFLADSQRLYSNLLAADGLKLGKIDLYFTHAFWEKAKIRIGPSFTDLPCNSLYPFYAIDVHNPEKKECKPAALTMYFDYYNARYWEGLQGVGDKFCSELQKKVHETHRTDIFPASKILVEQALLMIGKVYGLEDPPEPVLTSYRQWNAEAQFGFGYHQWTLDVDDREVRKEIVHPLGKGERIHICNEAFSDWQGWVNGSLRSCDNVLRAMDVKIPERQTCPQQNYEKLEKECHKK